MRKSFTRAVAFLLSVVLCVGLLPMRIFAEDTPKTWPTLTSLTLNEGAKLKAQKAAATNDRDIKAVTYENYAELKIIDDSSAQKTYSVGMVTLYVETALKSYAYKLTTGALNKAFPDTLPDGVKLTGNFEPLSFAKGKTEENGLSFAEFGTSAIYIYEFRIVVGEPPIDYPYPVIESLTAAQGAVLSGADGTKVPITGATFKNYKTAEDGARESEENIKISGEITIYILRALTDSKYTLASTALVATYSALDGYETNNIQGIFPAGDTSCTSYYYAFHSESNTQYRYRLTVQIGYPDNGMYVLEGSASRISPTKARVTFTASNAGIYYYACVDAGS